VFVIFCQKEIVKKICSKIVVDIDLSLATNCQTDTFSVTGSGSTPPVICGTNTGYHSKGFFIKFHCGENYFSFERKVENKKIKLDYLMLNG
jgi:hypothetical protein